jgi:hypothetical protein
MELRCNRWIRQWMVCWVLIALRGQLVSGNELNKIKHLLAHSRKMTHLESSIRGVSFDLIPSLLLEIIQGRRHLVLVHHVLGQQVGVALGDDDVVVAHDAP